MLIGAPDEIAAWTLARDGVTAELMFEPPLPLPLPLPLPPPSPPPPPVVGAPGTTTVIVLALVPPPITAPLPANAACVRNSAHIKTRILFTVIFSRCLIKIGFA